MERVEIQKSAKPVGLMIFILLAVGAAGEGLLFGVLFPRLEGFWDFKLTAAVVIAGVVVWALVVVMRQSSKKEAGLMLDERGLTDRSSATSIGFVPWSDILSVSEARGDFKRRLFVVNVKNPDEYMLKSAGMIAARQALFRQFGSPVVILPANLGYDPDALLRLLKAGIRESGGNP